MLQPSGVLAAASAALLVPFGSVAAQQEEIVVEAFIGRFEIERILDADNIDNTQVSAREVADSMANIARGRAPEDFWSSYLEHVRAWRLLAEVIANPASERAIIEKARRAVNSTFDDVERVALRYGARLPRRRIR